MPDVPALVDNQVTLTYQQLNQRANQLAHYLQNKGISLEMPVGLFLDRSADMIVAMLAVLKAGGAYVPLDPSLPNERLAFILADLQVKMIASRTDLVKRLPESSAQTILLNGNWQASLPATLPPLPAVKPENLAYILYTSGSTGQPKGVMIEHRQVVNLLQAFAETAPASGLLTGTAVCPFSFDVSVWEIFSVLCFGHTLHLVPQSIYSDGARMARYLHEHQIGNAYIPPALLDPVLDELEEYDHPPTLQRLLVGVEPIKQATLQRFRDLSSSMHIINGYGPTETTICATWFLFQQAVEPEQRTPIGTAVPNYQIYLLDDNLMPVPDGEPGEIVIGGAGVGRGYFRQPELTAERFINNPLNHNDASDRLYRSGDLARRLPDSSIEFIGRHDFQVKIRGFRVELGEIESVLGQHTAVSQNVVLLREDQPGQKQLVAYVRFGDGQSATTSELRRFMAANVPEYMIPAVFIPISAMPLTANGKIDRQALPKPSQARPELDTSFVPPRTDTERWLAAIWRELFGLYQIGSSDNFFDLGGHSLLVMQMLARIYNARQVELQLHDIFEFTTIASLAAHIDTLTGTDWTQAVIEPAPPMDDYPLSFAQERVWFIQEVDQKNIAYHFQSTMRFKGKLDVAILQQALTEVVRRHQIFRTTFHEVNGRPHQKIHPPYPVALPLIDLQHLPQPVREAAAQQQIEQIFHHHFDVGQLPLVKFSLLKLNPEEHILTHLEHHLVHDGWSFNVFLNDLFTLYRALAAGQKANLPDLPIQFADFAYWQRRWLADGVGDQQLAYWKKQLTGAPTLLTLPTDRPRPAVQTFNGRVERIDLPADFSRNVQAFMRQEGVTLFIGMMAAFAVLLRRYAGQDDLCIGSGMANRRRRETESLIGMVINNVVMRHNLSGNPTFRQLLEQVRQTTLEAYKHQDVPFDKVVEAVQPERALSYNPLFQAAFSFHHAPLPEIELPGLEVELTEGVSNHSAKFDLNVIVVPRSEMRLGQMADTHKDRMTLVWEYNTDLFDRTTMDRMLNHYLTLLTAVMKNPEQRIDEVTFLSEAEEQQLLLDWNDTAVNFGDTAFVQNLVAKQVQDQGEKPAVSTPRASLTYQQLDQCANQLAHYLIDKGIGPDTAVATCFPQSPQNVVAMLAVLKAGGAYVPLDPSYPPERLNFMATDAQVPLVLTNDALAPLFEHSTVVSLDDWKFLAEYGVGETAVTIHPDNLAYLIYTSGSTGQPKGIAITHRALYNLIRWTQTSFSLTTCDRATLIAGPAFDASVWEVWSSLTIGASLFIPEPEIRAHPGELQTWLIQNQISHTFIPTPLVDPLLDLTWPADTSLRTMLTGGDKLHNHPPAGLPFTLVNNYGPSECTVVSTAAPLAPQDSKKAPTIGQPIANTQAYILDKNLQIVPIGVPGELYVGGAGLARGYLRRPRLTAAAFIPNPFSQTPGARLYRTGDLVRHLANGRIEFLGRIDHQVKIRGFRIELGEIEALINQHPAVNQCLVVAHGELQQKQLIAYATTAIGFDSQQLRAYLSPKLPDYMIPTTFIQLDEFPQTPNGKIDRRALPEPDRIAKETAVFTPPETLVEELLADIWSEVLGIEQISIHDNFFTLGGHSLLVTRVLSRLQEAVDVTLPLRNFFAAPTIAQMAEAVETLLTDLLTGEDMSENPQITPMNAD
ncbi:MAG: amino acid adenylation domain-containing protein [Ardenticatenaceae bacterium]|nr:amino acid adenylation domain-containing protein [Ardenticatenaceae bacterium]